MTNLSTTHSSSFPRRFGYRAASIVRDYQRIIGCEIKAQFAGAVGKLPDVVESCVGGGSNAIGTFYDFIKEEGVRLIGVEAGGEGNYIHLRIH